MACRNGFPRSKPESMMARRSFLTTTGAMALGSPQILRAAEKPLALVGLAADAQYAGIDPANTRFYRQSLAKLGHAVDHWNGMDLSGCFHLGDLIDRDWHSFDEIRKPLAACRHPVHHLLGNHDFDVLADYRTRIPERLDLKKRYDSVDLAGFRFVLLDTTDVSTYAQAPDAPAQAVAAAALKQAQQEKLPQAQPWNGALSEAQLQWFDRTCAEAGAGGMKVIVCAHHPVFPENPHNLWNSAAVLEIIARHRHIVAWFNGHNHTGNFGSLHGVPFVNLHGMVETADTTAFATAALYPDRILLTGHGREASRELVFRKA